MPAAVNEFFRTILPKQSEGKIRILLCKGLQPDLMIFSEDDKILNKLAREIQNKATVTSGTDLKLAQIGKPVVWKQANPLFDSHGIDIIGNNKFQMTLNYTQLVAISDNLKLVPAKLILEELEKKGAVLGEGHRADNSDKLEIDYSLRIHQPTLDEFKRFYQIKSNSKKTRNPLSFMLRNINDIKSMDEVEAHAKNKPTSLTAEVLRELKFGLLEYRESKLEISQIMYNALDTIKPC